MQDIKAKQWNESYARGENAIFYPHEEVVRFLNRFIRKRIGETHFSDIIYRGDFYHSGIGISKNGEIIESAPNTNTTDSKSYHNDSHKAHVNSSLDSQALKHDNKSNPQDKITSQGNLLCHSEGGQSGGEESLLSARDFSMESLESQPLCHHKQSEELLKESLVANKDSHNKPKTPNPLKESPLTQAYQITQASKSSGGGGYNELLPLRGLDFGCGIGRQSILMSEFKIQSFGIDIAQNALTQAKALAKKHNANVDFRLYDGQHIPFEDEFFDFTLSYGVLDSLPFSLAQSLVREIARVSKTYFFCSLIGEQSTSGFSNIHTQSFNGEIEVQEAHERGTIQSFFDYEKILKLFSNTSFEIISLELKSYLDILKNTTQSRYYIVCKKANI